MFTGLVGRWLNGVGSEDGWRIGRLEGMEVRFLTCLHEGYDN
jgi:hypothetical protein